MTRALIVGSAGQDGSYLSERLAGEGVEVHGVDRSTPGWSLDAPVVLEVVRRIRPDLVFYLAAHHRSSEGVDGGLADELTLSHQVHVAGWLAVLDAVEREGHPARLFYAASSHVFGEPPTPVQDESTPFDPRSAYAVTKATGIHVGRLYRARGHHVSAGILYNHESPRRGPRFVSQRIVQGAVRAERERAAGRSYTLELGDLSATVDWGHAPDYVDAMVRIVRAEAPGDYVIATGVPHTIADFCAAAFSAVGLDWRAHVVETPGRLTRRVPPLVGNASRLRTVTGWAPSIDFPTMVQRLVESARLLSRASE